MHTCLVTCICFNAIGNSELSALFFFKSNIEYKHWNKSIAKVSFDKGSKDMIFQMAHSTFVNCDYQKKFQYRLYHFCDVKDV